MSVLRENFKKTPWYVYPPGVVVVVMAEYLFDWLLALGLPGPIFGFAFLAGLFATPYLVFRAGKWLSHCFSAFATDRKDIDF